ncbi:MAG: starch-binding protein, partial [Erysipelotrichaceae bacterium]|nr:starch-binding protein [Erysipelotrichaceae bacterium]
MNMKNKRILALLGVLSFVLIGCDDKPITPGSEIKHTVTFDKNYETENRFVYVEVIDGDPVAPLEVVREGYEVQWMIDGVSYDFTTPVVNNITLVASWEEILKPDTSKVESLDVSLNGLTDNATISVNDDVPLTIKILPTTANQGWNYTVSHPDVLSLNNEGVLHGIKAGNAALTITTKGMTASNTSLSKTINITVVAEIDVPSDRIIAYCEPSYSHVYAWIDGNTELNGGWPGELLDSHNENWKKKEYARTSLNIIFNEGGGGNQTDDLTISEAGNWYYYQNQWYTKDPIIFGTGGGGGGGDNPNFDPLSSGSHLDLPIWEDDVLPPYIQPRPADYWSSGVISPYQGSRTDIRDESIYFLMTTRFFDGDPSNNTQCWDGNWLNGVQVASDPGWRGDFKGLIQRLDYIKALGFTSIWITPVVQNASGTDYHGYHGLNFQKVDGRYLSSDTNFQDLITACHAKDMKIILDVVYNHTSNFGETNLLPMFRKNEPDWSINGMDPIGTQNGLLPTNYLSLDGGAQFRARNDASHNNNLDVNDIYHPEVSQDWEGFNTQVASLAGDCVDLNTENPIVAAYIIDCF